MPIWLRKFSFNKIKEWYDIEKEEMEKAKRGKNEIDLNSPNKQNLPKQLFTPPTNKSFKNSSPDYISKASRK